MMNRKQKSTCRAAAVEIGHTYLRAAVLAGPIGQPATVSVHEYQWRYDAVSLQTEAGREELAAALRTAAQELGLLGAKIHVCIGGDFCVTRVVSGTQEKVKAETAALERRSRLYLSLGKGPKALSGSVQQVDARHQHALLTVVSRRTLDTLFEAARDAGLQITCVEPSLISLGRLLGRTQLDAEGPSLIVNFGERGLEVGISYQGQMLLDYRPADRESTTASAQTVMRHLSRLQRYCDRYVNVSNGALRNVFLSDDSENAREARSVFEAAGGLAVETLHGLTLVGEWTIDSKPGVNTAAAVGALLKFDPATATHETPNLIEGIEQQGKRSLAADLTRCCWPLAAALLIALIGGWIIGGIHAETASTNAKIAELGQRRAQTNIAKLKIKREIERLAYDEQIRTWHTGLPADAVIAAVAQCQPDDIWLDNLDLSGVEKVSISGAGFTEEGVYDFMRTLRNCPRFADVALESTRVGRDRDGPVTHFNIQLELADLNEEEAAIASGPAAHEEDARLAQRTRQEQNRPHNSASEPQSSAGQSGSDDVSPLPARRKR